MEILGVKWLNIQEPLGIKNFLSPQQPLGKQLINPQFLTPLEWKVWEEKTEAIAQEIKKNPDINNREAIDLNTSFLNPVIDNSNNLAKYNLDDNLSLETTSQDNITTIDIPNSWSSIDELIGEKDLIPRETIAVQPLEEINQWQNDLPILILPPSPNNNINYSENPPTETKKITITSKFNPNPDYPKKAIEPTKINSINIENIAREVYDTIKQWLEIERERHGNHYFR